ncbi:MAG: autotransporter-associated N-terminal domain-containing protein [Fusobacterium varium]|uniref:autotransporter-associated N-terminal domain-containing protein n=1 Tax=Fusobacterium varium TaxID=856 RepID=UPI00242BCA63|nr:autotransporter-associated N-terminal domain-containing protein [Fusobacterium varium]UYI78468.1 MAG: autotransporter-associated N-terminal domain-containing protein [Fusobacterium varium]
MKKNDIEKSLKRFLKRKVSYSLSLLIAFMITGGVSLSAGITAEEIQETKGELLTKIQTEREEIKRKIAENERLIREYNSDFVELVRKGDFYSKPLNPSTQVFFSYQYLDNGKMKDVTDKEFAKTIDAVNKHYGTTNGRSLLKSTGNIGKDKIIAGNGIVVDNEVFRETIEVGANIKPVEPTLPTINPNVSVNVSAPVVNLGVLPGTVSPVTPSITPVSAPIITLPTAPGNLSVNVSTPSAVDKITVSAPIVSTPTTPTEKNIEIKTPTLPQGYEPTMITLPTAPTLPVVVPVNVSSPSVAGSGANPSVQYYWWNGNNGVISQISLKSGEYIINGNSGNYSVGVTGYDAEAFPGTTPSGTKPTENKVYNVPQQFFHTLLNVPYSYYGENTKIVFNSNNAKLIDLETEGIVNGNLDNRVTEGLITSATRDRLREYQSYTGIIGEDGTELLFVNKGEIEINGTGSAYFFTTSHTNGNYRTNYLDNEGTITVTGDKSIVYMHSPDTSQSKAYIYSNGPTGKIYVDGVGASLMQWAYSNLSHNRAAFVNEGTAEIRGAEAIALYMSNNSIFDNRHAAYIKKAIDLLGDKSIGMVAQNTNITNEKNIVKFNIGNKEQTIVKGNSLTSIFTNADGTPRANDPTLVEQGIGILMDNNSITKTAAQIEIGKYSYGGIGIFGKQGTIEILAPSGTSGEKSNIIISDGEKNTGIIAKGGDVKFNGDILIKGGKDNRVAVAESGKKITITGNVTAGSNDKKIEDSVILYAKDNGTVITVENDKLNLKLSGDSTGIFATSQGKVVANRTSLTLSQPDANGNIPEPTAEVNIYVEGKKDTDGKIKGLGLYTSSGGNISAKNTYVKVKNGAVGIASVGNGSKVDLTGGIIDYEGNGYAVYSSDDGEIDLTNGEIILRGKATALELDFAGGTNPIKLQGTRITVMSNDAIIANLKNAGVLNIANLESNIAANLGGVTFKNGTNGSEVFDKYKVAAIDGGTLNIDTNIDKGDTSTNSPGFYYYRRFLGQRLKINVLDNITVNASLNSAYASEYFKGQVVGLEINSSSSATGVSDTQINLGHGAKIVASRLDSGSGAIGAYINYGEITLDTGSSIEVEKTLKNENGVGIYAVNGSKITNKGNITVDGNYGIGIFGTAYRTDSSNIPVVNEFGGKAGEGELEINNAQNITLLGMGTVGIYAKNNNISVSSEKTKVNNTGNITVGDSNTSTSVGIYGEKATISNTGTISVGAGGVAIYATEGSRITDLGTLDLGADGVGVMVDGASTISANSVTLTSNNTGTLGKTGIFYKGTLGTEDQNVGVNINASALDKGTAIYVENMNVTSSGTLNVGKEGVGIFVKGNSTQIGTNTGTIDLTSGKTGAVGMYTKTANIVNDTAGIIEVRDSSQIGMYAEGTNNKATNTGTINLNVDSSTGIYVKSGATAELNGNIGFTGKSSVGVFAENATVNFKDNLNFTNNNENKNIYVYGKDAAVGIDSGKIVTVDGMGTPATTGNKTVGIYLENTGNGSTFNGTTGQLVVTNEAVGIYSKGNNTLNVNITANGAKTTGVFIDGNSTIAGTVTVKGTASAGAIGVYGSDGIVTIGVGGLTLKTDADKGTGMYLVDGAYAAGEKITVNNTATVDNIGVYYSKGSASGIVTNGAEIELTGSKSIGIYAADGISLVNSKDVISTGVGTNNNIASYVGGNSTLTSNGNITMAGADNIGIYTGKGTGVNSGIIDISGGTGTSSAGMVAKTDTAADTATVENKNKITVGSNLGMYIAGAGTSSGKNTGTITATTGTGVYVDGSGNSFNGTGGTIASNTVGIYLKNTDANKITTGTLNIGSGGVGVFGEDAKIDFAVNVTGRGAVGVAAKGNSIISGNIKTGQGSVGAFLLNDTVTFNGAVIETGASIPESGPGANDAKTSVGILFDAGITSTYTMNNVTVNAKDGVGIYLGGTGMTLNHNGNITTEGGIGIYVKNGTTLATGTSTLNISNGGTGVYIEQGTANLGLSGNLTFNFGTGGGIGVFNNGGTLNLGNNITITGSGSLAATSNGNLISSGNLSIGEGGTGLLGTYDSGTVTAKSITNNGGTINVHTGGIGLAAIKGTSIPTGTITINNSGIINAEGISTGATPSHSIGIYTDVAEIVNTGSINVGTDGIGIYSANSGKSVQNDTMIMTGTGGIGVYLKDATTGLASNNIISTSSRNTGVVLEGVTSNINAGTVTLGDESVGVMAVSGTTSAIDGTIKVGASSSDKSAIGAVVKGGSNAVLTGTASITAGTGGIGVYAEGAGTTVVVSNAGNISVGTDGIYMYSKGAALSFTGDITADAQIGIVADGGSITASGSSSITAKNGGIGAYIKNAAPIFGGTVITVQSGIAETNSSPAKYSVGIYYDGVASIGAMPVVTQTGNYTIGRVLNNSAGSATGGISIGSSGSNQVGVMVKGNSNLAVTGGVAVTGNSNIGVYGESSAITVTGDISAASVSSLTNSSIGVFLDKGSSYTGTVGNISAGSNSIGIYGKNMVGGTITQSGTTMNVGTNGVGIYGEGNGNINLSMGTITLSDKNSIGVYAKGLNSVVTGNMTIGTNTSIGIVSEGNGNVTYTGDITIADKIKTGSVGIYKLGGTAPSIITSSGNWSVGNSGYGIYLKGQGTTVNNSADMTLGMSAVGIFSSGVNVINNTGNIVVGETDVKGDHNKIENHLNSIGIYTTAGTTVNNSGNITVNYDHSVGIYGDGSGTKIQNTGTINVDRGGVGILVRDGAVAINAAGGNIILGSTSAPMPCTATTVGMAAYSGAKIENAGTITVNEGVGMLIGVGATFDNSGTIYLKNGIGIEGPGALNNYGHIVVLPGGNGTPGANVGVSNAEIGSVKIESDGTITINDKYVSIGGTLSTVGNIVVNGAYVDVTTGTPLFNANSVSGEVRLLPNFAATGNGISYEIEGFINTAMGTITGTKLTPVTSPLFIAKVTDKGNLVIAKRPYADLVIGEQFDALYNGLDNILKNSGGNGKDAEILKGLNQYLEGLPKDQFERETALKLAETRGDIYATIQGRMQDINQAFANSFYELESSYNLTKDSSKYSVIYTDGNYKDSTLGIDDYDYKVMGLLYMKEKEGTEYGSKYGYTIGFAGSKFDFDDGGSKEDVYSLRVGAHRVKNLSDEHKVSWLSRIELGYNRHIAKRKLNLQETFENKGEYNTYSVAFDNKLTKVIYTDLSRELDVYADLDLEYGKVDDFKEHAGSKGGLEVQIKDNDYLSAQAAAGVKAQQRIYVVNDVSVKVTADVKYAYELGDNYNGNKARLKNGGEGYYSLITPDEKEGKLSGKVGLTVEKANHMGVTFEVEAADESNRKDSSVKYGVRFNYKF